MEKPTFAIDFQSDTAEFTDDLKEKVERRLAKLGRGRGDVLDATVTIQTEKLDPAPREYRARIIVNERSGTTTALGANGSVTTAVMKAVESAERQIREGRARHRSRTRRVVTPDEL